MTLTEREKEILNCMVGAWEENEAPMVGGVSYAEVFELLERLGLQKPEKLIQRLKEYESLAKKYRG